MTKKEIDAFDAVEKINNDIQSNINGVHLLEIESTGMQTIVKWLGVCLWNSDDDARTFNEEKNDYEPIEEFLRKKGRKLAESVSKQLI